jgi:hypothetical protein
MATAKSHMNAHRGQSAGTNSTTAAGNRTSGSQPRQGGTVATVDPRMETLAILA